MKLLFIYLALILAISFYMWVNIFKEGNQDTNIEDINKRLVSTYEDVPGQKNREGEPATTEKDTSPDILKSKKITPGITTIDRYEDDACNKGEYIYCIDGQIECQDIFGEVKNNLNADGLITDYTSGNTFVNTCGSYINKVNLSDYNREIEPDISTGIYFDLSNCTDPDIGPWRAGGDVEKIGKKGSIIPDSYTCHISQSEAEIAMNLLINAEINSKTTYNEKDDVFILQSYLNSQNSGEIIQALIILNSNKQFYRTINGQRYYYGKIEEITNDTYTVSIKNGNTSVVNVPKNALLKDSLYNKKSKDYYSDIKTGDHIRPVCKSGRFTSCMTQSPFVIENGMYVTNDQITEPSLSLYSDGSDPNMKRPVQHNDLVAKTPFSGQAVNLSGIIDNADSALLQYNYFDSQLESPFVKCIADYGSNIGDPLCCNQSGYVEDTKYICPEEVPTCRGYSAKDTAYGYCN